MIESHAHVAHELRLCIEALMSRDHEAVRLARARDLIARASDVLIGSSPRPAAERTRRFREQMGRESVPDGESFEAFIESPVSGTLNPLSPSHVEIRRQDRRVEAHVRIGIAFEGAPGRAHGGFVAALFDDVMGALQLVIEKSGYTRSLHIDYLAAFPVGESVVVTAREIDAEPGRFAVEAEARAADRPIARAVGVFTEIDRHRFARH